MTTITKNEHLPKNEQEYGRTTEEADLLDTGALAALLADAPAPNSGEAGAPEAFTPEPFTPDTEGKVDWVLGKIAAARAEARLIRESAELMAREKDREADGLEWRFGPALQAWLRAELGDGTRRSKRLFHGVLGYRTRPAGVSVTDDAAALAWARENLPEAVAVRLDKKALAEALLTNGESVDFATLNHAEEVFYIK